MKTRDNHVPCPLCGKSLQDAAAVKCHTGSQHTPLDRSSGVFCAYCMERAKLMLTSSHRYAQDYGPIWECDGCQAWVGCHPGTWRPLGRLANHTLRKLKRQVHEAFDPIWKSGAVTRGEAYHLLAVTMGLHDSQAHVGMMDEETAARAIEAAKRMHEHLKDGGPPL
jgi:hypothetical protein